jgi:uncharacterized protein YndB with AHSA1/START domain
MSNAEFFNVTTPTDREIVITRIFNAPRKLVYEAWTNPKYLPLWMLGPEGWSMPVCETDLRPGGSWHFVWRHSKGQEMEMRGSYREVHAPERVVTTESWGPEWPETLNTVVFTEQAGKTTVTITLLYPSKEHRDNALATGMKAGMAMSYDRLERLLLSSEASAPAKDGKHL